LDSEWREFSFEEKHGLHYDYKAVYNVRDIDICPERVQERSYIDEKKIQDGWDYVLDRRGNVMQDEDMLVQAAERLKPNVKEELRRSRAIL